MEYKRWLIILVVLIFILFLMFFIKDVITARFIFDIRAVLLPGIFKYHSYFSNADLRRYSFRGSPGLDDLGKRSK